MTSYNFEPFANTEEYKTINTTAVKKWVQDMIEKKGIGIENLLDVATGTGLMSSLFLEHIPEFWNLPHITCLDQSKEALLQASTRLRNEERNITLSMIESSIEKMDVRPEKYDAAVWGNGIHYLSPDDQLEALRGINSSLKEGGWLFLNTAFYNESRPENTLPFYQAKVRGALKKLREKGIPRGKKEKAEASAFLLKEHYEESVKFCDFDIISIEEFEARLYQEAWEHISSFWHYAKGAMPGFPPREAGKALKDSVEDALEKHGKRDEDGKLFIPRIWLSISAVKI